MFIGIMVESEYAVTTEGYTGQPAMKYFDATRISSVDKSLHGTRFTVDLGDPDGHTSYITETYDEGGLIELIMQARLRPAEFLPSLYVGKTAKPEAQPNSVAWSAPGREKDA